MVLAGVGVGILSYRSHQEPRIRVSPPANLDAGISAREDRVKLGSAALSPASPEVFCYVPFMDSERPPTSKDPAPPWRE